MCVYLLGLSPDAPKNLLSRIGYFDCNSAPQSRRLQISCASYTERGHHKKFQEKHKERPWWRRESAAIHKPSNSCFRFFCAKFVWNTRANWLHEISDKNAEVGCIDFEVVPRCKADEHQIKSNLYINNTTISTSFVLHKAKNFKIPHYFRVPWKMKAFQQQNAEVVMHGRLYKQAIIQFYKIDNQLKYSCQIFSDSQWISLRDYVPAQHVQVKRKDGLQRGSTGVAMK